jgi:hypothetical protein
VNVSTRSTGSISRRALEQLLKAALFMPLAITLKALVARLESSIVLMAEELDSLLVLIASSVPVSRCPFSSRLIC